MSKYIKLVLLVTGLTAFLYGCQPGKENKGIMTPTVTEEPGYTMNETILEESNYFETQNTIDKKLQEEAAKGYSFEEPMVIVNPYGNSPLTAVIIFRTSTEMGGTITVKGKSPEDNILGSFDASKDHIVPVYGLYAGSTTAVSLTLEDGSMVTVDIRTDKMGFSTEKFEVEMSDESAYDFTKLTFACDLNGNITALDSKGDLRWLYNKGGILGVKALSNGHLAIPSAYTLKPLYYKSGILEIDLLGKVYHEYAIPGGMHHDIFELSDGNLLVASDRPDFETVEDYIVEIDRQTGEIVWELDLTDLIDRKEGGSINRTDEDWFHNNGIWYDEKSDIILLSGRHVDAIVAVDKSDKSLKWILGDPDGWSQEYQKYFFAPLGEDFEWQYAQHQVTMLSNGDIMCFDNGAGRTKTNKEEQKVTGQNVYSRAVAYRINEEEMTIRQIWEYGKEQGAEFYSEWISGAISLENDPDNIWITFGANLYHPEEDSYDYGPSDMFAPEIRQATNIVQVKNHKPVYHLKMNFLTYRTIRLSPYQEVGSFDAALQGGYLGSLGVTDSADVTIDLTGAKQAQDITLTLDPVKLTFNASYSSESKDDLMDSYLVLQEEDGTVIAYPAEQSASEGKEDKKEIEVNVSGWISTKGLEEAVYNVYVILGGTLYNTGDRISL